MSRISFEGIGEVAATFACGEGVKAGQVVKLTGDGTVGPCGDGERFCGVALSAGEGFAAVQLGGLIRVAASGGALSEGWNVKSTAAGLLTDLISLAHGMPPFQAPGDTLSAASPHGSPATSPVTAVTGSTAD